MEFRILGPIEAFDQGRSLPLGGAKPRAVLAVLLLHAHSSVSAGLLAGGGRPWHYSGVESG